MSVIFRLVLFPVLLSLSSAAVHAAQVIKLGVTVSLSGKYAELGSMNEKAYKLWVRDVNRRGGLLGRPVELAILDDKSDPELAKALYERFIVKDRVDLVLGPYSSEITEAVSSVTEHHQYPLLASGASADSLWQEGRKYLFGVYVTTKKYTIGFLELLVKSGINKVAIVSADDLFSKDIEAGTKEWAKRYELEVVFSETFKKGTQDIDERIRAAKSSGAEALIVAGHFDDAVNGRKALGKVHWTPKAYYATVGPALQKFSDVLKGDADFTYSSSQWETTLSYSGTKEFAQSFNEAYHIAPSYHAASAYAAGQIIEAAVHKTKSIDRAKLTEALSTLDTITVMGRYGVDRDGRQVRHFTTTVQWQNGKKETVAPRELMTAKPIWR